MKGKKASIQIVVMAVAVMMNFVSCRTESADYVSEVNPYIGNISHLLVPTFPTIHMPNSMLRVYPDRSDYTSEYVNGLPVIVTHHREKSAFKLYPLSSASSIPLKMRFNYDNEKITPYSYDVELEDNSISVSYALSSQSAIYRISFTRGQDHALSLVTSDGQMQAGDGWMSGYQNLQGGTRVYVYMETESDPYESGVVHDGRCAYLRFYDRESTIMVRYGVSYISEEQAKNNLRRQISGYDIEGLKRCGKKAWNRALGRIDVKGGTPDQRTVFYTSFYRTFERPICISEDGRYYSAYDHQVHNDDGHPFYVDDWLWDTYRAAHPLRAITDAAKEEDIIASFLRMARQKGDMWMPTFPEVTGDSRRMNSNHGIPVVAEAMALGLDIDLEGLYDVCSRAVDEKTLAPWSSAPSGWIDEFYEDNGYIPALRPGEEETDPNVHGFEKRQPVAVTLGTSYDEWCLSLIAQRLGLKEEVEKRSRHALDYRNLFNPETLFFHPKDKDGNFIEGVDYHFSGGLGAREYYGENNGWVYRWDVPHNIGDLIDLMGGNESFCQELDKTFSTPLGKSKYQFYAMLPDHTGNVGQFSMANEPSLHVPYLYNYAGKPWKTQKRIRQMLDTWFRNDLMGVPGDEDGGGMTSFVVFSAAGFYPVTPGTACYSIGSPLFDEVTVHLSNGNDFIIKAQGCSHENKYIQSAKLNGKQLNSPWFTFEQIKNGATLELKMGCEPMKSWGTDGFSVITE